MSKLVLFVGATGSGKTSAIKRVFPPNPAAPVYVYDVQREYREIGYQDFFTEDTAAAIDEADEIRNASIIFEEATQFFRRSVKNREKLAGMLVGKRHRNITVGMVFHSLRAIPEDLIEYADVFVIFRTKESPDAIRQKYRHWPEIQTAYQKLRKAPKFSHIVIRR